MKNKKFCLWHQENFEMKKFGKKSILKFEMKIFIFKI
jgi:hypothetical protein